MKLSVIIVNYRSAKYIVDCINSAMQYLSFSEFEWIVVDNDSGDNSEQIITQKFPFVQWIAMGYNAGFARANNKGIQIAKSNVVLLLNPDTLIINDTINQCYNRFMNDSFAACGVQQYFADGTAQISGNFFMKGGLNHLLPLPYWGTLLRTIAFSMKVKKPNVERASTVEEVDWISGAFLMVKKSAIEKVGLMDEDFFLYAEEVEWCSRLQKAGRLCIYGDIAITHICGEAISNATQTDDKTYANLFDKKGLQLIVSNHLRIRKQFGVTWFLFQLLNYTWAVPVFFVCSFFDHLIRLQNPFAEIKKIYGLSSNVCAIWVLAPKIISNKPHFYKMF